MDEIPGELVRLRRARPDDVDALVTIRETPEVHARWGGDDVARDVAASIDAPDFEHYVIEEPGGKIVGAIQWSEEADPDYRHAQIDIFIDPSVHRRGYATDAIRALVRYLIDVRGHHRLTIDPAADNGPAIAVYSGIGFRPVGTMRQYERGPDGTWHDGLLMELLAEDWDP
jgi:aminoglycoside 6'-N-acetyltransferase